MPQITVRQATLADAASITAIHTARVDTWTRRDIDGEQIATPYDDLTLYERWLNAGPWSSVEMCAVHLANLLRGGDGIPLVAEVDGMVGAEAEVFIGREPEPFGHHINISTLVVHPDYDAVSLGSALLTYIRQIGEAIHCRRVTVADAGEDAALFEHHRYTRAHLGQRLVIPAQEGRVFYKAGDLAGFSPRQIEGWHMPLGRYQNARAEWDRMLPGFWNSVPQIVEPETYRLHLTVTGQEACVLMQQDRHAPERVQAYVWAKRPANPLLILVLCDWTARHNYESLVVFVWDYVIPMLEVDTQPDDYTQQLYVRPL
jgi:ribosomal protein S18 acetylase RimI-like enzyme